MKNKNKILIHASSRKIKKLKHRSQYECKPAIFGIKPCGLWYSPGKEWVDYCKENLEELCASYKFFYVVVPRYTTLESPNKNKVLRIQNEHEFDEFSFKYDNKIEAEKKSEMHIKWINVAEDFGGIEIIPFLQNRSRFLPNDVKEEYKKHGFVFANSRLGDFWYSYFDVASGCIWNPDAIKKFYQIEKKEYMNGDDNEKLILVRIK